MDIIIISIVILSLIVVIAILLVLILREKEQNLILQKEYLKQLADMTDKVYFRKPEDFVQNKAIEKDEVVKSTEEEMIPFDQAPLEDVMKAFNVKQ